MSGLPRVVVLDLDDTLYSEHDYADSGFRAVDVWLRRERGLSGFLERARRLHAQGRRADVFDAALAELGVPTDRALVVRLVEIFREHHPDIRLLPDALALLDRLHGRWHLALLTDGYLVAQRRKIAALGLAAWCRPVVCTDAWGRAFWKPHARGFEHIEQVLGLPPRACLYVADNPTKDFFAPHARGWRTVRILRPTGLHAAVPSAPGDEPHHLIASLDELTAPVLDEILSARH